MTTVFSKRLSLTLSLVCQSKPEPMLDASSKKTITMGEEKEEIIKEVLKDIEFYLKNRVEA